MRILALETSCDETAIAIAEFSGSKSKPRIKALSNIVSSQVKLHARFGGVVPNLARREHEKNLAPILLRALKEAELLRKKKNAGFKINDSEFANILEREQELLKNFKKFILPIEKPEIDAIAVTYGPGLAPALWAGINFAKALAVWWNLPLIPTNHMAGHLYSATLQTDKNKWRVVKIKFPALALLVSGGHTELVLMKDHGKYKIIGSTLDDASGEAFDKVAKMLGLPYPGGPEISRLAIYGSSTSIDFPRPMINAKNYDFSFSGLKTSVLYYLRDTKNYIAANVAAAFEQAVVDVLVAKTIRAARQYKTKTILLGGGVAANKKLRKELGQKVEKELPKTQFLLPDISLTGDNALMIALAAFFNNKQKTPTAVGAEPNLTLS